MTLTRRGRDTDNDTNTSFTQLALFRSWAATQSAGYRFGADNHHTNYVVPSDTRRCSLHSEQQPTPSCSPAADGTDASVSRSRNVLDHNAPACPIYHTFRNVPVRGGASHPDCKRSAGGDRQRTWS